MNIGVSLKLLVAFFCLLLVDGEEAPGDVQEGRQGSVGVKEREREAEVEGDGKGDTGYSETPTTVGYFEDGEDSFFDSPPDSPQDDESPKEPNSSLDDVNGAPYSPESPAFDAQMPRESYFGRPSPPYTSYAPVRGQAYARPNDLLPLYPQQPQYPRYPPHQRHFIPNLSLHNLFRRPVLRRKPLYATYYWRKLVYPNDRNKYLQHQMSSSYAPTYTESPFRSYRRWPPQSKPSRPLLTHYVTPRASNYLQSSFAAPMQQNMTGFYPISESQVWEPHRKRFPQQKHHFDVNRRGKGIWYWPKLGHEAQSISN